MSEPQKFSPAGALALDPRAFGMLLITPYIPVTEDRSGVTVLSVRGPLEQFRSILCDSYEDICARVDQALEARPRALVLSIASPGGKVAGAFEAADRVRAACAAAGVPLYAYIDGAACSAAYALACAAQWIAAPLTASVGSIGVIAECVDASAQLALTGVRVDLLTSGSSKADGNPSTRPSGPALTRMQATVDGLAEVFFAHVAARRSLAVDDVRAFDAGVFLAADARARKLIDEVQTLEELLRDINNGSAAPTADEGTSMTTAKASKGYEDAIAALRKAASSDDENEAKKAKRMLAAELAEDDAPPKDEEEASAEGDPPPPKKDDDDDEEEKPAAKAASVSAKTAGAIAAQANSVEARLGLLEQEREAERVQTMLAARPDLAPGMRSLLANKPHAEVKALLAEMPAPKKTKLGDHAAAATVAGTAGEGQGDGRGARLAPEAKRDLDVKMGLVKPQLGVEHRGSKLILGAPVSAAK